MARFDLSDEEWAIIGPFPPNPGRGLRRIDDMQILNGFSISYGLESQGGACRNAMANEQQFTIDM